MKMPLKSVLVGLLMLLLAGCALTREEISLSHYYSELQSLAGDTLLSETQKAALAAEVADFILAAQMYADGDIGLEDMPPKPRLWEMRDQQRAALVDEAVARRPLMPPVEPQPMTAPAPTPVPLPEPEPEPEPPAVVEETVVAAVEPPAAKPAPDPMEEGEYSDWLAMRSDKEHFHYRMKLVEQDGEVAKLRLQLRIGGDSGYICSHSRCDGYVVTMHYSDEQNETVYMHFRIERTFNGVHTVPELLTTSLKAFADGSSRGYDPRIGVVIYFAPGQRARERFISGCLDDPLTGRAHACQWTFKPELARHIR